MANASNFLTRTPSLIRSCTFKTTRVIPNSLPYPQLKLRAIRKDGAPAKQSIFINQRVTRLRPYHVAASVDDSDDSAFEDTGDDLPLEGSHESDDEMSVSTMIEEFYHCVNEGNVNGIAKLVCEDCWFDDYSFPERFEGRKEVCSFFDKLTKSMGEHVKFQIEEICEGEGHVGCAIWHLEWKDNIIPFTRGSTFFKCLPEGDKLVIREARVLIESPVKPGVVVVGLLDLVSSVFDEFPNFTRWFLRSPQAFLRVLVNIYNLVAAPFINPLLVFYTQMCCFIYKLFCYVIGFLRIIAKSLK